MTNPTKLSTASMKLGAEFSKDGRYRYRLWREWDESLARVVFVMLNPSTADAKKDDPTIRRCIGFARLWDYGRIDVVNLFGYRATKPRDLRLVPDPIGPENETAIVDAISGSPLVIAAWGNLVQKVPPLLLGMMLRRCNLFCLGTTLQGSPRHPLYVKKSTRPQLFMAHT